MASHDFAFMLVDGCIKWVEFPSRGLRAETMKLVERWLRGEVESLYLGRRSS